MENLSYLYFWPDIIRAKNQKLLNWQDKFYLRDNVEVLPNSTPKKYGDKGTVEE